jgi:hypothetical protein
MNLKELRLSGLRLRGVDGSRDNEIKIKDLPGIQVGNWQDWTTAKGVVQPLNEVGII